MVFRRAEGLSLRARNAAADAPSSRPTLAPMPDSTDVAAVIPAVLTLMLRLGDSVSTHPADFSIASTTRSNANASGSGKTETLYFCPVNSFRSVMILSLVLRRYGPGLLELRKLKLCLFGGEIRVRRTGLGFCCAGLGGGDLDFGLRPVLAPVPDPSLR